MTIERYITICGYLFNGLLFMLIALIVIAFGFELVIAIANAAILTRCVFKAHKVNLKPVPWFTLGKYFWSRIWDMFNSKPYQVRSVYFTWRGIGNYTIHGVKDGTNDT